MSNKKEHGFSMVELAIVLAIIALIVGAVAVGKDLQRNAEYRKIANKFVGQWAQAYNQYYERTGVVIGDSFDSPTGVVGGKTSAAGTTMGGSTLANEMIRFGIRLPQGNGRGTDETNSTKSTIYRYLDQSGIPHLLTIDFRYTSTQVNGIVGNYMYLQNVTPKLGSTTDAMIDGVVEYNGGYFRGSADWADTSSATASKAAEEAKEIDVTAVWKMNQ
ncbi:MAG: prepilin-type N-terminal cleavage/methylation domain-containing protein [Magnetococcales bacterium]|nr:prepilin-type N-terminal cleavage/methylation domain-containing protein [Magnetococcales bacterium]MBF0321571.1 prepilin-type N-terminal cleavage/methylation domain-containing protein [Magnetococcales bacterium]